MNVSWPPPHLHRSSPFVRHLGRASPGRVRQHPPTSTGFPRNCALPLCFHYVSEERKAERKQGVDFVRSLFGAGALKSAISSKTCQHRQLRGQHLAWTACVSSEENKRWDLDSHPAFLLTDSPCLVCPLSGYGATNWKKNTSAIMQYSSLVPQLFITSTQLDFLNHVGVLFWPAQGESGYGMCHFLAHAKALCSSTQRHSLEPHWESRRCIVRFTSTLLSALDSLSAAERL